MAQSAGSEDPADGELTKVDYAVVLSPLSKSKLLELDIEPRKPDIDFLLYVWGLD